MKLRSPLPQRRTRLEIIPLIDIMFFLLASFMMVSLTMSRQQTVKVNLPAVAGAASDFKPDQINVAVGADGLLHLDTRAVALPELEAALAERHRLNPETPVYISGDENARHGAMIALLDAVRRAGFRNVAFQVRPAEIQPKALP
jgi:biopolymer transport protein ExbD